MRFNSYKFKEKEIWNQNIQLQSGNQIYVYQWLPCYDTQKCVTNMKCAYLLQYFERAREKRDVFNLELL